MAQLHSPQTSHFTLWDAVTQTHVSVLKMCLFYAVPLSIVPPAMLYYAGIVYGEVPELNAIKLQTIAVMFFLVEVAMTFLVAYIIQRTCGIIDMKPAYDDCYKLAVVVPTPLWLAPLFMFVPSFMLNLTAGAAALIISGMLIFYAVPSILKVEEPGHAVLLSGSILSVGLVAWAAMLYVTMITWSFVSSSLLLML